MEVIKLTRDNVSDFEELIPEDIAENMGRTYYRGLGAMEGDRPAGAMIWTLQNVLKPADTESHIVWLKAEEEETGKALFAGYGDMVKEDHPARTTFSLPARTSKVEKQLLNEMGFTVGLMEGDEIVAHLSEIAEIPFLKKIKVPETVKSLRSATQRGFNRAVNRMARMGYCGLCEDISDLPRVYFENDVSCYSEQDGLINGFFLCHKRPSGRIVVELMASVGKDYQKTVAQLITQAVTSALEIYPPETETVIDRHNYATLALGEKLFPRGFGIPVFEGSREEPGN